MKKNQWFMMFIVFILSFSVLPSVSKGATVDVVIKVNNTTLTNTPISQNGQTYMPLTDIAKAVGDTVAVNQKYQKVSIKQKNGVIISVKANQSTATYKGKSVPLKTQLKNGKYVSANIKAIYQKNQVYVPVEFLSAKNGLGYAVKASTQNGQTVWEVKRAIATTSSTPSTAVGKTYPDGWKAPVIKSSWTPDWKKNKAILEKELGLKYGESLNLKWKSDVLTVYQIDNYAHKFGSPESEAFISISLWKDEKIADSYRVPIVAMEVFKFYFGADAQRVWNYFDTKSFPTEFTANGRTVTYQHYDMNNSDQLFIKRK